MTAECEHEFQFQGTVWRTGDNVSGSGALHMIYADKYYCRKCLEIRYGKERTHGHSYGKPLEGTLPK